MSYYYHLHHYDKCFLIQSITLRKTTSNQTTLNPLNCSIWIFLNWNTYLEVIGIQFSSFETHFQVSFVLKLISLPQLLFPSLENLLPIDSLSVFLYLALFNEHSPARLPVSPKSKWFHGHEYDDCAHAVTGHPRAFMPIGLYPLTPSKVHGFTVTTGMNVPERSWTITGRPRLRT